MNTIRHTTLLSLLLALITRTCLAQVPRIDSVTPSSGNIGSAVTIIGANFSSAPADNIVYFGGVRATVTSASPSSLMADVPAGAGYAPISVTVGGLTASSKLPFLVSFNRCGNIDSETFAPREDFPVATDGTLFPAVAIADLDGDGKPDLILLNNMNNVVSVLRNTSVQGSITAASFAPQIDFPTAGSPFSIAVADLDGDGKLDLVITCVCDHRNGPNLCDNFITILRNTSTPGTIDSGSFAAKVEIHVDSVNGVAVGDLDGDGKPEIVTGPLLTIFRNTTTIGTIDANSFILETTLSPFHAVNDLAMGDLDGDGRPDLAAFDRSGHLVSLFRNTSTVGGFAFDSALDVPVVGGAPESIAIGDLNGDGKLDVAVGLFPNSGFPNDGTQNLVVLQNKGGGGIFTASSFTRVDFPLFGDFSRIGLADLDGDGRVDIVGSNDEDGGGGRILSVLPNRTPLGGDLAANSFGPKVSFSTSDQNNTALSIAIADLDGDGLPDMATGHAIGGVLSVFRNIGTLDTMPPVITPLPNQIVVPVNGCAGNVEFVQPTATDNCSAATITSTPASGSVLGPGTHTIQCTAIDAVGNISTSNFTITVLAPLRVVFQSPLEDDNIQNNFTPDGADGPGTIEIANKFNSGQTLQHKVVLLDCAGHDVTDTVGPSVKVHINVTERTGTYQSSDLYNDVPENYSGVGDPGSLMQLTAHTFQYNLKTSGYESGTINSSTRFFRSVVWVEYLTAPGINVGQEDVILESK